MPDERLPPFRCGEDFASSWLEDELEIVTPFYMSPGTFACRPVKGRKASIDVAVEHVLGPFGNPENLALLQLKTGRVLSRSHRLFLSRWDGCTLFSPVAKSHQLSGLRLYSITELLAGHRQAVKVSPSAPPLSLFVIGELLGSGHFITLDDSIPSGGESPVVVLSESKRRNDPVELAIVATTVTELLLHLMEAPAVMLERLGGMHYHANGKFCVPVTYRME